ncbi:DEAD/DEAH box helicase [Pedobacter frigidisoli]|uniref:DEAD/DEAH box helicase n=1 Tax=Pedobacter frigidisoli TaxID=2530455 RepID=UPI0029314983|nr:DEAD/DEAH box helicase [Pedobacter frigidisoli]
MYELLSEPVRRYIRDKRWEVLRPIQLAAIGKILGGEENLILASRTASGKTEAAFLPILSKVDFSAAGVKVLYISPLIALINDQFNRVEELCQYLDVKVTKWHGEASKGEKNKLVKNPQGIVLITPESIEAMLANAPHNAVNLFSTMQYVVIDEIHSFIGSDRGIQLKSLLARLQGLNVGKFLVVGLSATIGDYDSAKKMTGDVANTKVLLDKNAKEMEAEFRFFEMEGVDLPIELLKDLYLSTRNNKVLIFPNSRGRAEEIAVKLSKLSARVGGHGNYFSHHSSVDKELREYIETFAKTNVRYPFAITCTSTLELGIDIGSVEQVVQVDATFSIASLVQRIGRSGRREGEISKLLFYATDKWSLLQSLACFALYREGYIEPLVSSAKPYDILWHQLLAYVKQLSGCSKSVLLSKIQANYAFRDIKLEAVVDIIEHLITHDFLEQIGGELIIGVEGEWIVNSRDFYSVFKTEANYKVVNYDRSIGEIPFSPQIDLDQNLLLAAKIWKVIEVDHKAKKIAVIPANDGKKPLFFGAGADIHPRIRERMLEMLYESAIISELAEPAGEVVREMRKEFQGYRIESLTDDRPLLLKDSSCQLFSFQGSRINKSLSFLFKTSGTEVQYTEHNSSFVFSGGKQAVDLAIAKAREVLADIDFHLENAVIAQPGLIDFSKWALHLPLKYKCEILLERYFDFSGVAGFLDSLNPVLHSGNLE